MVLWSLVPQNRLLNAEAIAIKCAHEILFFTLADVEFTVDQVLMKVETTVSDTLPIDVLLGVDVPELI